MEDYGKTKAKNPKKSTLFGNFLLEARKILSSAKGINSMNNYTVMGKKEEKIIQDSAGAADAFGAPIGVIGDNSCGIKFGGYGLVTIIKQGLFLYDLTHLE